MQPAPHPHRASRAAAPHARAAAPASPALASRAASPPRRSLFGACIILNLFLAVLCDNFAIAEDDPEVPKDDEVDAEKQAEKAAAALNHTNPIRKLCLKIAVSQKFMYFVTGAPPPPPALEQPRLPRDSLLTHPLTPSRATPPAVCIVLNALLMIIVLTPNGKLLALHSYQPSGLFWTLWVMNAILTAIFTFESAVKLVGLGWKVFKMDSFNNFDLVVVIFSLVDVAFDVRCLPLPHLSRPTCPPYPTHTPPTPCPSHPGARARAAPRGPRD